MATDPEAGLLPSVAVILPRQVHPSIIGEFLAYGVEPTGFSATPLIATSTLVGKMICTRSMLSVEEGKALRIKVLWLQQTSAVRRLRP